MSYLIDKHPVDLYEYKCTQCRGVLWLEAVNYQVDILMCHLCGNAGLERLTGMMNHVEPGVMVKGAKLRVHRVSDVTPREDLHPPGESSPA